MRSRITKTRRRNTCCVSCFAKAFLIDLVSSSVVLVRLLSVVLLCQLDSVPSPLLLSTFDEPLLLSSSSSSRNTLGSCSSSIMDSDRISSVVEDVCTPCSALSILENFHCQCNVRRRFSRLLGPMNLADTMPKFAIIIRRSCRNRHILCCGKHDIYNETSCLSYFGI